MRRRITAVLILAALGSAAGAAHSSAAGVAGEACNVVNDCEPVIDSPLCMHFVKGPKQTARIKTTASGDVKFFTERNCTGNSKIVNNDNTWTNLAIDAVSYHVVG